MDFLNRKDLNISQHPERILQFGEGNFLRCFFDWQIDILNEKCGLDAGVLVVKPRNTPRPLDLNSQDGLYTSIIRGYDDEGLLRNEKRLITCINREISVYSQFDEYLAAAANPKLRFIISNTTEAGIVFNPDDKYEDRPQSSFPAKLTRFLHQRYLDFKGSAGSGLILIPCELIDYNGEALKEIVLKYAGIWELEKGFTNWLLSSNTFCSTLVDRIVTGYPDDEVQVLTDELGYKDNFITAGEYFHLFVIQGPAEVQEALKLSGSGLDVRFADDLKPYKQRKVGILNGCHTALVPVAWLCGFETVGAAVADSRLSEFLSRLLEAEIIPGLVSPVAGLTEAELMQYAESVIARFKNPFINHQLLSISLNSMTKFKTRLLPQFLEYNLTNGKLPPLISLSLAALAVFYRGELDERTWPVSDDEEFIELFSRLWKDGAQPNEDPSLRAASVASGILGLDAHWGVSLGSMAGLQEKLTENILSILRNGMRETLEACL